MWRGSSSFLRCSDNGKRGSDLGDQSAEICGVVGGCCGTTGKPICSAGRGPCGRAVAPEDSESRTTEYYGTRPRGAECGGVGRLLGEFKVRRGVCFYNRNYCVLSNGGAVPPEEPVSEWS